MTVHTIKSDSVDSADKWLDGTAILPLGVVGCKTSYLKCHTMETIIMTRTCTPCHRILLIVFCSACLFPLDSLSLEVESKLFRKVCGEGQLMNSTSDHRELSVEFEAQCLLACLSDNACESVTALEQTASGYRCELYEDTSFHCVEASQGSSYMLVRYLESRHKEYKLFIDMKLNWLVLMSTGLPGI